jgi:cytochrome c peroxidase
MFRTSPLRNVALQPSFFHNGAFTRLEDAVLFHLDPAGQAPGYNPTLAGVDPDLRGPVGPIAPVLARLDPLMQTPHVLSADEFRQLVDFLRNGLLDLRAKPENLRKLIPARVPSGRPIQSFQ